MIHELYNNSYISYFTYQKTLINLIEHIECVVTSDNLEDMVNSTKIAKRYFMDLMDDKNELSDKIHNILLLIYRKKNKLLFKKHFNDFLNKKDSFIEHQKFINRFIFEEDIKTTLFVKRKRKIITYNISYEYRDRWRAYDFQNITRNLSLKHRLTRIVRKYRLSSFEHYYTYKQLYCNLQRKYQKNRGFCILLEYEIIYRIFLELIKTNDFSYNNAKRIFYSLYYGYYHIFDKFYETSDYLNIKLYQICYIFDDLLYT
jgi:hypothetical protein